jgi:hypothetical protein
MRAPAVRSADVNAVGVVWGNLWYVSSSGSGGIQA